jgi:cytochrome P450
VHVDVATFRGHPCQHVCQRTPEPSQLTLHSALQRENQAALQLITTTLTELIAQSKALLDTEKLSFDEENFLSTVDPSILHFLIAAGDDVTSQQLRDDLMTMLIAGHETTAAVLTWTTHLLTQHPEVQTKLQAEVRTQFHQTCAGGLSQQQLHCVRCFQGHAWLCCILNPENKPTDCAATLLWRQWPALTDAQRLRLPVLGRNCVVGVRCCYQCCV